MRLVFHNMDIDAQLEAVLFFKAEPLSVKRLSALVGAPEKAVEEGLAALAHKLAGRGVALVRSGNEVELRTAPEAGAVLKKITADELAGELGKAGAEVLALILYRGAATRREIDWIRGVNSSFTLRELGARGLVARTADKRGFVYRPTTELLAQVGVARAEDLPDYASAKKELADFVAEES